MKKQSFIILAPRIMSMIFIGFISMFALDVFSMKAPLSQVLLGLIIHLIPSFILLIALFVAWRWPKIGGALYIFLGLITFFALNNRLLINFLLIGSLLIIGVLFMIQERDRVRL